MQRIAVRRTAAAKGGAFMRREMGAVIFFCLLLFLAGCAARRGQDESAAAGPSAAESRQETEGGSGLESISGAGEAYTVHTRIQDVAEDPAFGDYGRLIFPWTAAMPAGIPWGSCG